MAEPAWECARRASGARRASKPPTMTSQPWTTSRRSSRRPSRCQTPTWTSPPWASSARCVDVSDCAAPAARGLPGLTPAHCRSLVPPQTGRPRHPDRRERHVPLPGCCMLLDTAAAAMMMLRCAGPGQGRFRGGLRQGRDRSPERGAAAAAAACHTGTWLPALNCTSGLKHPMSRAAEL